MGVESKLTAGVGSVKKHWIWFAVVGFLLVGIVLAQDHKKGGKISQWFAGLPLIGKLFA